MDSCWQSLNHIGNLWTRGIIYIQEELHEQAFFLWEILKNLTCKVTYLNIYRLKIKILPSKHTRKTIFRYLSDRCILNNTTVWLLKWLLPSSAGALDFSSLNAALHFAHSHINYSEVGKAVCFHIFIFVSEKVEFETVTLPWKKSIYYA